MLPLSRRTSIRFGVRGGIDPNDKKLEKDKENDKEEIIYESMRVTQEFVEGLHMDEPVHEVDRAVICGPPLFNRAMIEHLKDVTNLRDLLLSAYRLHS